MIASGTSDSFNESGENNIQMVEGMLQMAVKMNKELPVGFVALELSPAIAEPDQRGFKR